MAFVDVFSLSFLGVLILYVNSLRNVNLNNEIDYYEIITIDQLKDANDHLAFIGIRENNQYDFWIDDNYIDFFEDKFFTFKNGIYNEVAVTSNKYFKESEFFLFANEIEINNKVRISKSQNDPRRITLNTTELDNSIEIIIGYRECRDSNNQHPVNVNIMKSDEEELIEFEPMNFRKEDKSDWLMDDNVWFRKMKKKFRNGLKKGDDFFGFKYVKILCNPGKTEILPF